ncbi:MAG: serine hydroxymethyltransferase, partial [Proteobacteria bacterium]|nr:serine hydroxymethyltransferase [Pseudomonadota bacterium]
MTPATAAAHASTPLDELSQGLLAMLRQADPEVERIMAAEADRQASTLELIASENH